MSYRSAMMTIEVLIALVIIVMTIVMSATTSKYFNMTFQKKVQYIDLYTTVLSIKDKIEDDICSKERHMTGSVNHFEYTVDCKLLRESLTFVQDLEDEELHGLHGAYKMQLNEVTLQLRANTLNRTYNYYLTKAKAR